MDFGGLGPKSSSAETRPSTRVLRKLRLQSPSPSASSDGSDANSHEDEETRHNAVVSEGEEGDASDGNMSSGESSDGSLETRYLNSWSKSPSASSRRQARLAAFKRWNPTVSPECQLVDMTYKTCSPSLPYSQSIGNVERSTPAAGPSSGVYLRSSTVNHDDADEAPKEGSLEHAVNCMVLVSGGDGISQEDVLVSLHEQLPPAMLAHTDWEADAKQYLKSRLFAQVQGQYVLRKHSSQIHGPSSSKRKETSSQSSGESGSKGRRKFKIDTTQGRVSMSNIMDHGLGGRGSLKALQEKIEEEHGVQKGARQCALTTNPTCGRKPWQCPLMAMEDHRLCEHHFKKADGKKSTRLKAKVYQG